MKEHIGKFVIVGSLLSFLGLILLILPIIASLSSDISPLIYMAGCLSFLLGMGVLTSAAGIATSGSSIAHRGEEQIPIIVHNPNPLPQPVNTGAVIVTQQPQQPTQSEEQTP